MGIRVREREVRKVVRNVGEDDDGEEGRGD